MPVTLDRAADQTLMALPRPAISASGNGRWPLHQPELNEQAELVGYAPVLDDLAVLETGNIEHIDLERLPGGREAHDRARVDAASLVERPDGVTVRGDLGCAVFSASLSARKHRANSGMDPQAGSNSR